MRLLLSLMDVITTNDNELQHYKKIKCCKHYVKIESRKIVGCNI